MPKTIMLVDDEIQLLSLLTDVFEQEGYTVVSARNGEDAIYLARHEKPDLIILDVMMPELDGYGFIRQHRQERDTPIILLTARVEETDKIIGLQMGADDYVTKPFSPRELVARVQALLRRTGSTATGRAQTLRAGPILLDQQSHMVEVDGTLVDLTRSEFEILAMFMSAPGRVFSRQELLENLQGAVVEGYDRTIDVHVKNLRAKIEADPREPQFIETVYGVGYRFSAPKPGRNSA
ncbi:MAG: response regulator transcription factor [Anaerolineales bacterium]|nr:response regulator transcription factor [Anaerolineales bacterium]